jgi:Questin oxidase-like
VNEEATHDTALDFLAAYGHDLANGFTSHAPMVVEALASLGRADAVLPWLDSYRPLLRPRPAPREPLAAAAWREALGREERTADWMACLRGELAEAPWREVLARWLPRLAPGYCGAATHGALRVAHATRALGRRETPQRVRELGDALGAWAASYQTLPTHRERGAGWRSPSEAIAAVPLQPGADRRFRGSIVSALDGLSGFAAFAPVIDWIDADAAPDRAISALTQTFARVYLGNARDPLTTIVFVHGVTSAAALRSLVPHADAATARELIRYGWQAGAALYASFGSAAPSAGALDGQALEPAALAAAAVAHGDDHAIKLTEACVREHAVLADPVYLRVAHHALAALPEARR